MRVLWEFMKALPELLALVKLLMEKKIEEDQARKVRDDIKTIHSAFLNQDASALNELFSK